MKTVSRDALVSFLDKEFGFFEGEDDSLNGLQFEGSESVRRAGFAVDACVESFEKAAQAGCDFLVVHHGLFWKKMLPAAIKGCWRRRLSVLERSGLSLYASHLPLDAHPRFGNNAELARLLCLREKQRFGDYRGGKLGFYGKVKEKGLEAFASDVKNVLGGRPRVFAFGPKKIRRIGVCSGGSGFAVVEAGALGVDALLIGELTHSWFHNAKEEGVNVIAAGHYATETVGLKALARVFGKKFGLETRFVDAPTGL